MASIQKRPNGMWRARYRDEAGKEHAAHRTRKVDAQRWLDEQTAALVRGDYVNPSAGKITFRQWYVEWSSNQVWAEGTIETANLVLESVTFADIPMQRITSMHISRWLKSMTEPGPRRSSGLASSTRRTRFNYVRMAFTAAVKARVIRLDPTADVNAPKVPKSETRMSIPAPSQVGRAVELAPEQFQAFVAVCAFAGLRLGEAAGLRLGDIDFLKRTLTVQRQVQGHSEATVKVVAPKYESGRVIHLADQLIELLAAHVERNGTMGEERWLFHSFGRMYNRNSAGNQWRLLRAQVGMGEFTLHDFRHFYASGLIASGCDVVTVQRALGHASSSITLDVYSHLWPNNDDRTRAGAASMMRAAFADSPRTRVGS